LERQLSVIMAAAGLREEQELGDGPSIIHWVERILDPNALPAFY
jgi:hypothetical protein